MKRPADWGKLDLSGDPILVVGRRPRAKQLEAFVVDLHKDTFEVMRAIAETTIGQLVERERLDWHPFATTETDEEYLTIPVGDLPSPRPPRDGGGDSPDGSDRQEALRTDPQLTEAAALLRLVLAPGDLENLHPGRLAESNFRFYALAWEHGDATRPVAFISEYDATAVLRKANSFFRFEGTLRLARPPDLALDDRADLVVTTDEIAILRPAAFDHLFSDVRALLNDVPSYTQMLKEAMTGLPVTPASLHAIEHECATRPSLARRLRLLATSPIAGQLTANTLRTVLIRHGGHPTDFIKNGALQIQAPQVGAFLDIAEGRWFEADFTSEPRRAARWSRRAP